MPHYRYLRSPFTQLPWVSPMHSFISYLRSLWGMGYHFICKTGMCSVNYEKWTKTMSSELSSFSPFSLCGRRTHFSRKLTVNLANPDCYQRDYIHTHTSTNFKPLTKCTLPTLSYWRKGELSFYSYTNKCLAGLSTVSYRWASLQTSLRLAIHLSRLRWGGWC